MIDIPNKRRWLSLGLGGWPVLALGGLLFISVLALLPSSLEAQCKQWDVRGAWSIYQGKAWIPVFLSHKVKFVTGSAQHQARLGVQEFKKLVEGSMSGTVEGDSFSVRINWPDGPTGIYQGTIGKGGVISGITYDKNKPSSNTQWQSSRPMKCADANIVKPPPFLKPVPPPKPNTAGQGPPKTTPPAPAPPPTQSATASATIPANPTVVTIPDWGSVA